MNTSRMASGLLACAMLAFGAAPAIQAKEVDLGKQWNTWCEAFPARCQEIKQKCAANPARCDKLKQAAAQRRAQWEKACKDNPQRCEAMKKRRAERAEHCKADPVACRKQQEQQVARVKAAKAACADFKVEAERKQCMVHHIKQAPTQPHQAVKGRSTTAPRSRQPSPAQP